MDKQSSGGRRVRARLYKEENNMPGKAFKPGNKVGRGRPRGSRNKRTIFQEAFESHGEAIIKQVQMQAFKGDPTAMRLWIERLSPPSKAPNPKFRLPPVKSLLDVAPAIATVMQQVARGRLSPQEGAGVVAMLVNDRPATETEDMEKRLRAVEERHSQN